MFLEDVSGRDSGGCVRRVYKEKVLLLKLYQIFN